MTDVERDKDQDALSRTAIHAEGFGFTGGFVFGADASTYTGGPDPDIDGLRGRGRGLRFGVIGWTEKADVALPAGGLAGVVGTGHNSNAAKDAAGVAGKDDCVAARQPTKVEQVFASACDVGHRLKRPRRPAPPASATTRAGLGSSTCSRRSTARGIAEPCVIRRHGPPPRASRA